MPKHTDTGPAKRAFSFRKGHDTLQFLTAYARLYHQGNLSAALASIIEQWRRTPDGKRAESAIKQNPNPEESE